MANEKNQPGWKSANEMGGTEPDPPALSRPAAAPKVQAEGETFEQMKRKNLEFSPGTTENLPERVTADEVRRQNEKYWLQTGE